MEYDLFVHNCLVKRKLYGCIYGSWNELRLNRLKQTFYFTCLERHIYLTRVHSHSEESEWELMEDNWLLNTMIAEIYRLEFFVAWDELTVSQRVWLSFWRKIPDLSMLDKDDINGEYVRNLIY